MNQHLQPAHSSTNTQLNILQHHTTPYNILQHHNSTYYRKNKLSGKFSTLPGGTSNDHVAYQFTCREDDCQSSYIGFTTKTLNTRAKQHWYKSSSIHQHFVEAHQKPSQNILTNIIDHFKILYRNSDLFTLKIAESTREKCKV